MKAKAKLLDNSTVLIRARAGQRIVADVAGAIIRIRLFSDTGFRRQVYDSGPIPMKGRYGK